MRRAHVLPKPQPLGKERAKALMATAIARLVADHGLDIVAAHAGCSTKAIRNAMGLSSEIEANALLSLMPLSEGTILDELLAEMGFRVVPIEAPDRDHACLLAETADLTSTIAAAKADGFVDHREEAEIVNKARPLVQHLAAEIARFDRKRA